MITLRNKLYYGQCVIFSMFLFSQDIHVQENFGAFLLLSVLNCILMQSILNRYLPGDKQ